MLERKEVYQAYLSIDPEVRIRRNVVEGIDVSYYIAIKSNGELIRREVEIPISKEYFYALADMVEHPFVKKDFNIVIWIIVTSLRNFKGILNDNRHAEFPERFLVRVGDIFHSIGANSL